MDDGGDVLAERDDADIVAGLVALLLELVDDAAHGVMRMPWLW